MGFLSTLFTRKARAKDIEAARYQKREATRAQRRPERRTAGGQRPGHKRGKDQKRRSRSRAVWKGIMRSLLEYRSWQQDHARRPGAKLARGVWKHRAKAITRDLWKRTNRGRAAA
jgi:hypothetical protein